ncbi:hypothetical protein KJY73_17695 [Bowmanella sp. Y26]|uniref:ABC transporter substrate-binding protein n=1 Tax=Bowmanella yangjiangensis TaxID=2811230 RepID=UPI001BDC79A7|nr:ABC transporter substrate-binding protein [Bowmanella yangjiangensis]MBT1065425.1 hypothetical protein [Bowmanella yangjiangensis]
MSHKPVFRLILILICLLLQATCFADTLRRAVLDLPSSFDPRLNVTNTDSLLTLELFAGLTRIDGQGQVVGDVASRWERLGQGTTYRFYLREDARWSDGKPVVAMDFVQGFRHLLSIGKPLPSWFLPIQSDLPRDPATHTNSEPTLGMFAVSEQILDIVVSSPSEQLLYWLADSAAMPLPSHLFAESGYGWARQQPLVSNGPYQLAEAEPQRLYLRRSSFYQEAENVAIEQVVYERLPETITLVRYLAQSQADVASGLAYFQIKGAKNLPGYQFSRQRRMTLLMFFMNPQAPALQDLRVREALYMAMDRNMMVHNRDKGEEAMFGLIPDMAHYEALSGTKLTQSQQREQARQLMKAAGYNQDKPLLLRILTSDREPSVIDAALAKRIWADLPVKVEIEKAPFREVVKRIHAGQFDMVRRMWQAEHGDPMRMLDIYLPPNLDWQDLPQEKLRGLLEVVSQSGRNRNQAIKELERFLMSQYLTVPVLQNVTFHLLANRVIGWSDNALARNESRWLSLVE